MNLVIVESPAKGRTIERFLGEGYKVAASLGHVRDLPDKELGVDTEHNFAPHYQIKPTARKTVVRLKELAKSASAVFLATDYDREGEAIAWHTVQALGLDELKTKNSELKIQRITFHEITKNAIVEAVKNPRSIDMDLVDAQQARRVADRLVGYKLSPFLWRKVFQGLSAGRVQSVAVRLIVDREREIQNFKPQEYWTITGNFQAQPARHKNENFNAELIEYQGKRIDKLDIKTQQDADKIVKELSVNSLRLIVNSCETAQQFRWPFPPYTTSTLQQDANRRLGFSAKKTMRFAQDLYEHGLITYMRTDSTSVAWVALDAARKLIEKDFGSTYLPEKPRVYKTKALAAQEAHEAVRPTYIERKQIEGKWSADHKKLYDLIWRRLVACQMNPVKLTVKTIDIKAGNPPVGGFRVAGQVITFDGWLKVYPIEIKENKLPTLKPATLLTLNLLTPNQHFTEPPDRYSEATLVKALEQHGIGRPSTYAPIISTIQDRGYTRVERRFFYPEQVGFIVTDLLKGHFPDVVDIGFTAMLEAELDLIAEGKKSWQEVIKTFYEPFAATLAQKEKTVAKSDLAAQIKEGAGLACLKCGKPMVVKVSRFGRFLACSGYPACKNTKQLVGRTGVVCPECKQGELVSRRTKKGKTFWGCERYPECKYATWQYPKK